MILKLALVQKRREQPQGYLYKSLSNRCVGQFMTSCNVVQNDFFNNPVINAHLETDDLAYLAAYCLAKIDITLESLACYKRPCSNRNKFVQSISHEMFYCLAEQIIYLCTRESEKYKDSQIINLFARIASIATPIA